MKRYLLVVAVLALGLLVYSGSSLAQEEEELEYSWGVVSSISADQIVVTEYDHDTYEDVNVTYTLDPQVKFKNVELLEEIKVGDNVEIDYVIRGDKKLAKTITAEKLSKEDYSSEEIEY